LVKVIFDSSVLIASFVPEHPKHQVCLRWLERVQAEEISSVIATHTLAECYSVLTGMQRKPKITVQQAQWFISESFRKFEIVPLNEEDYQSVIARIVSLGLSGGIIYDALIAQVALKFEVEILLTLNAKDFLRLGEEIAQLVQVPA
jgi:predicted nucleic acid-binding protein